MNIKIPFTSSLKNYLVPNAGVTPNWNYKIEPTTRMTSEWRTELQMAAQQISIMALANKHDTVYLVCDGSYESQVMIQAFYWIQAKVVVVIPRFTNHDNMQVIASVVVLLEDLGIPYAFCDIDARKFFATDSSTQLAAKVQSTSMSVMISTLVWNTFANQNKYLVFPHGLPKMLRTDKGWHVVESTSDFGLFRVQGFSPEAMEKNPGVPMFFRWSPELLQAYMNDWVFRRVMMNDIQALKIDDSVQSQIFTRYFKLVGERNWTGFEKFELEGKRFFKSLNGQVQNYVNHISFADYSEKLKAQIPDQGQLNQMAHKHTPPPKPMAVPTPKGATQAKMAPQPKAAAQPKGPFGQQSVPQKKVVGGQPLMHPGQKLPGNNPLASQTKNASQSTQPWVVPMKKSKDAKP